MSNVHQLPDAYLKRYENGDKSNHAKMLELNETARDDFKQAMEHYLESLDIEKATGETLDRFGEIVNQKRGELKDEQYRLMIKFKIAKYLSQGDYNSLMLLMKFLLNSQDGDFVMQDIGNATVEITSLPLATMINAGFTSYQVITLVEELLPAGVRIKDANFEGTFILSGEELEQTDTEGFANIEETIGGSLGLVLNDKNMNSVELPI